MTDISYILIEEFGVEFLGVLEPTSILRSSHCNSKFSTIGACVNSSFSKSQKYSWICLNHGRDSKAKDVVRTVFCLFQSKYTNLLQKYDYYVGFSARANSKILGDIATHI
jgi:hypothetical protein